MKKSLFFLMTVMLMLCMYPSVFLAVEGASAVDFSLPDIINESRILTMKDFRGNVVLLNIWASWCTGCKEEMPEFMALKEKYAKSDFEIIAVNIDNKKKNALSFLNKLEDRTGQRLNFIVLYDDEKRVAELYNPRGLPASYLIDRDGIVVKKFYGSFSKYNLDHLITIIEDLIGGKR